jgi:hypothetical protein
MPNQIDDPLLIKAALIGLQQMKADIDSKMSDLQQRLGIGTNTSDGPTPGKAPRKRRRLSAAGRANIVAALKKRWAARRKEEAKPARKKTAARRPAKKGH